MQFAAATVVPGSPVVPENGKRATRDGRLTMRLMRHCGGTSQKTAPNRKPAAKVIRVRRIMILRRSGDSCFLQRRNEATRMTPRLMMIQNERTIMRPISSCLVRNSVLPAGPQHEERCSCPVSFAACCSAPGIHRSIRVARQEQVHCTPWKNSPTRCRAVIEGADLFAHIAVYLCGAARARLEQGPEDCDCRCHKPRLHPS
jgi:hypothetical protein